MGGGGSPLTQTPILSRQLRINGAHIELLCGRVPSVDGPLLAVSYRFSSSADFGPPEQLGYTRVPFGEVYAHFELKRYPSY